MFPENLIEDGNFFKCGKIPMRFYIPRFYLDTNMAYVRENFVRTFGVMPVSVLDKDGNPTHTKVLNCPYMIDLYNITLTVYKDINFFKDDNKMDYMGVSFYPGDRIMKINVVHDNDNMDVYLKYLLDAKIRNFIKLDDLPKTFDTTLMVNGINLNIPHSIKEILIAYVCRDPNNPETPYGEVIGKNPKASQYGYRAANNREIVARSSISTSIGFEDMDAMIISGLNTTTYRRKQPQSPLEKIIKM